MREAAYIVILELFHPKMVRMEEPGPSCIDCAFDDYGSLRPSCFTSVINDVVDLRFSITEDSTEPRKLFAL